jgi:hypothetical protein
LQKQPVQKIADGIALIPSLISNAYLVGDRASWVLVDACIPAASVSSGAPPSADSAWAPGPQQFCSPMASSITLAPPARSPISGAYRSTPHLKSHI